MTGCSPAISATLSGNFSAAWRTSSTISLVFMAHLKSRKNATVGSVHLWAGKIAACPAAGCSWLLRNRTRGECGESEVGGWAAVRESEDWAAREPPSRETQSWGRPFQLLRESASPRDRPFSNAIFPYSVERVPWREP